MTKSSDIYFPTGEIEKTFINSIWRLTENDLNNQKEIILPKGTVEIIFNFSDKIDYFNPSLQVSKSLPHVFINGINFKPFELTNTGRQEFLGIQLNSIGLRLLFNISAKEFNDSVIEGREVCSQIDNLAHELFYKQTSANRMKTRFAPSRWLVLSIELFVAPQPRWKVIIAKIQLAYRQPT